MEKETLLQLLLKAEDTLFHVTFSILQNEADAADAVQEAILKAYGNRHKLKNEAYFKTWITRIAMNESYAIYRKNRKYVGMEDPDTLSVETLEKYVREEYLDLYQAVSGLEEKLNICIVLFYFEGYSVAEMAQILRVPQGTIKSRLNRGRKLLKGLLEGEESYAGI